MNAKRPAEPREPQDTVDRLIQALEQSERRHASLERTARWGVLGFVAFVVMLVSVGSNLLGPAYAQQGMTDGGNVARALNDINRNLQLFGMMQSMMQGVMQSPDVQDSKQMQHYIKAIMEQNPGMDRQKAFQMAFAQAAGQVFVDTAILVKRLRQDSDIFRDKVKEMGGTDALLAGIQNELARLNLAMASVPAMAGEMNIMNRQMSVMSYGVGSTMGRMGSIMPW